MSEKTISPLRQRMIEDMSVRNFVEKTRNDYIRHVKTFTAFLGRSPETATSVKGIERQQIGTHSLLLGLMEKCYANEPRVIKRDQCGEMYRQHTWRKQ